MSHPAHQHQSMPLLHRHPLAQQPHQVAEAEGGGRGYGSDLSSFGATLPPPAASRSSTIASSLGPPTPPHSSEEGEPPLDAIDEVNAGADFVVASGPTMGVAVMAASTGKGQGRTASPDARGAARTRR